MHACAFRFAVDLQQAFEVGGVGGKRAVGFDDGYDACGGKFGQGAEGLQEAAAVYPDAFGARQLMALRSPSGRPRRILLGAGCGCGRVPMLMPLLFSLPH